MLTCRRPLDETKSTGQSNTGHGSTHGGSPYPCHRCYRWIPPSPPGVWLHVLIRRYLYRKSYPASVIAPYNAAKANLGLVRKALRVGKNVEHFKAAAIALQSPLAKVTPARPFSR